MRIKLSFYYIIIFLLLFIVMLELHESVHITTGRIICGAWGSRDFNVWGLCDGCQLRYPLWWLATLAGPLFSFAMMWAGMFMLNADNIKLKTSGFSLIFANIPFGRITQAMVGGGDEMLVAKTLLQNNLGHETIIIICSVVLLLICFPPIIKAWRIIANKHKWLYITGFLTLPLVFMMLYTLTLLNGLLKKGILAKPFIMGTPLLITLHTGIALAALIILRRGIWKLAESKKTAPEGDTVFIMHTT